MPILNYTTQIDVDKTVMQIQKMLSKWGAKRVMIEYDADGIPQIITFSIVVNKHELSYRLPNEWKNVQATLKKQNVAKRYQSDEHAKRVAWRIIRDWLEGQIAILESGIMKLETLMFPHAIIKGGKTIAEAMYNNERIGELLLLG